MRHNRKHNSIKIRALIGVLLCSACFSGIITAADYKYTAVKPEIVSPRLSAMGGANPALTTAGLDTLSTNPAALAYVEKEVRILGLSAELSGQFLDIPGILDAEDPTDAMIQSVRDNDGVYFGGNVTGPISFGIMNKNFAFGVFNRTYLSADVASITSGEITGGEEILITGGYGVTLLDIGAHELSVGIQLKGFYQFAMYESGTIASIVETMNNFDINGQPLSSTIGFGFDLGLLYRLGESFSVGVTCRDVYTPIFYSIYGSFDDFTDGKKQDGTSTNYDTLDRDLSLGVAWTAPIPRSWKALTGFTVAAGYDDFLSLAEEVHQNPVLNFTFGAEIVFFNILHLRAGINECYPAAGLGLDLKIIQLDMAVYGQELGLEPGDRPLYNMALGLTIGF